MDKDRESREITGLRERLTDAAEQGLARHVAVATEWFPMGLPHLVSRRERGARESQPVADGVSSALVVNLLTEDNLPAYHLALWRTFGDRGVWGEWLRLWTAEEGRHAIALRDYVSTAGLVDVFELERLRMAHVRCAFEPAFVPQMLDGLVYLTIQELATRIAHRNTGELIGEPTAETLMTRISMDENLHHVFYRDLVTAAFDFAPSATMAAVARQVTSFVMPGWEIPGFRVLARQIASAGVYDLEIHLRDVLHPLLLRRWNVFGLVGLSAEAEGSREVLAAFLARMDRLVRRRALRRTEDGVPAGMARTPRAS